MSEPHWFDKFMEALLEPLKEYEAEHGPITEDEIQGMEHTYIWLDEIAEWERSGKLLMADEPSTCCGCVCYVCADAHNEGEHTKVCRMTNDQGVIDE